MTKQVLEGIKVVDFGLAGVIPLTALYLGNFGATVVRIDSKRVPDPCRTVPPFKDNIVHVDRAGQFAMCNTNKYSISLNLDSPQGIDVARRLVAWADVVCQGWSPGTLEKRGLGVEDCKKINPGLITVTTSSQGRTGPRAKTKGYGFQLVGAIGFTNITGWPDRSPVPPYYAYSDYIASRLLAVAALGALLYRKRTGKGQNLDLSQYEASLQMLSPLALDYSVNKRVANRMGNRSHCAAPHGAYRCLGDDEWCVIAVFNDREWQSFCQVLGNPPWTKDPRFATLPDRKKNEEELNRLVEEWTVRRRAPEVMETMQRAGVAAGVVLNPEGVNNDPQIKQRGYFTRLKHQVMGECAYDGMPFKLSKTPGKLTMPAPCVGEHTDYVCTKLLGISDEEFIQLLTEGAFE